jgi:hypothetical protein
MEPIPHQSLLNLICTIQEGLARRGFQMLSCNDLEPLWEGEPSQTGKLLRLHDLAKVCAADFEFDNQLKAIRLLPAKLPHDSASARRAAA